MLDLKSFLNVTNPVHTVLWEQSARARVLLAAVTSMHTNMEGSKVTEVCFFLRDCAERGVSSWQVALLQVVIQRPRAFRLMAPPTSRLSAAVLLGITELMGKRTVRTVQEECRFLNKGHKRSVLHF